MSAPDPWEREYATRGRLWRKSARLGPWTELLPREGFVLDLACGDGKGLRGLRVHGRRLVGLDASPTALSLAQDISRAGLVRGDLRALPIADGRADAVVMRYALGALTAPPRARAADEAWRVLRPGGTAIVEEFSVDDFRALTGEPIEPGTRMRNQGITTHYWSRDELARVFPARPQRLEETAWSQRAGGRQLPRRVLWAVWVKPTR